MAENFLVACWNDAGYVGKSIIVMLVLISLYSWSIILIKWQGLRQVRNTSERFLVRFRTNRRNIFHLYPKLNTFRANPITEIYKLACQQIYPYVPDEAANNPQVQISGGESRLTRDVTESIGDTLSTVISTQTMQMQKQMVFLATAASASPFIGLFGTVWGVMIAFRGMGMEGTASLATVAPGISEALITTAAGLAVAIPALVGYNYLQNQIRNIVRLMNDFTVDLLAQSLLLYEADRQ